MTIPSIRSLRHLLRALVSAVGLRVPASAQNLLAAPAPTAGGAIDPGAALGQKIQAELSESDVPPEHSPASGIPRGELLEGVFSDSMIYPGTENIFKVYV